MSNTLFVPEIANAHARSVWYQVMKFLDGDLGIINYTGDPRFGGEYVQRPRVGQLSTVERANIASLSSSATNRESTNTNEKMVKVHRTMLHEFYDVEPFQAGMSKEFWSVEIASQFVQRFAQKLLGDIYNVALGSCEDATISHQYSVYQDTATAGDQVDLTVDVLQAAKYELTDQMENLTVGVCHSKQWNDLRVDLLAAANLYNVPNVVGDLLRGTLFMNVLGVNWIVDDQIPTVAGSNATRYNALLLRPKGKDPNGLAPLSVDLTKPMEIIEQHVLGGQSAKRQMQAFANWRLGASGSSWDSNVGANPTDANLRLATSWDAAADDVRMHGMVEVSTN